MNPSTETLKLMQERASVLTRGLQELRGQIEENHIIEKVRIRGSFMKCPVCGTLVHEAMLLYRRRHGLAQLLQGLITSTVAVIFATGPLVDFVRVRTHNGGTHV